MWLRTSEPTEAEWEVCGRVGRPSEGTRRLLRGAGEGGGQETANPRRSFESSLGEPSCSAEPAGWEPPPPRPPTPHPQRSGTHCAGSAEPRGPRGGASALWGGLFSSSLPTQCGSKEGRTRCCQGWSDTERSGDMEDTHRRMVGIKEREARCRNEGRWRRKAGRDGGAQGAGIPAK